jgi:hypothetical protein
MRLAFFIPIATRYVPTSDGALPFKIIAGASDVTNYTVTVPLNYAYAIVAGLT